MGWISTEEMMPPQGLHVLIEASGHFASKFAMVADHCFFIASWIVPSGEKEGSWLIWDETEQDFGHLISPTVHAWMPLPKHYQQVEMGFEPEPDMMEHAMFEDDPEWLYKDGNVYEQMSLDDFMKGATT